ncbi:MAG: hypothetical protein R2793_07465 [Flavobacteriaceae bacterium]
MKTKVPMRRGMTLFLLLFCVLFGHMPLIFSQNNNLPPTCTTAATSNNFIEMENIRGLDYTNYEFHLKVYVHVLTHSDKGPGQSVLG